MGDDGGRSSGEGGMTRAMRALAPGGPKVLRIAAVREGRVVEERTLTPGALVSVGRSERNSFVIDGEGVPASFALFRYAGGRYVLTFTPEMAGRVAGVDGVRDLDEVRASSASGATGGPLELPLDESCRGRVALAGTVFLFQFVDAPAVRARPRLPSAVHRGLVSGIDWPFTAFGAFSFMTMFGFLVFLDNADWPLADSIALVPEPYAHAVFDEEPPSPPPARDDDDVPEPNDAQDSEPSEPLQPAKPQPRPAPRTPRDDAYPSSESLADRKAHIAQEARAAAESLLVGAAGLADGVLTDVLRGGAIPGDAAQLLSDAAGVKNASASAGGTLLTHHGPRDGSGQGDIGALAARGSGEATRPLDDGKVLAERPIPGRATIGEGSEIGGAGDFDAALVVAMIKRRLPAIRACYERELKHDPTLAGKLTVEFTVVPRGTVSGAKAVDNTTGNDAMARCVAAEIGRIRFSDGPKGGEVTFAYPFVFAPQH